MFSPRRAIIAVGAVILLVFLFQSRSSSYSDDSAVTRSDANGIPVADRSYPPPSRPKKPQQNQQSVQDISSRPLREQLRYHFPYDLESKFPSFIWQTWKYAPSSGAFEDRLRPKEATWTDKHPGFVHEVIVDDAAEHLVRYLYSTIPQVAEAYVAMPLPVLKADFFRYLILLARGGIYTDIDTEALQTAANWLPPQFDQSTIGLIVGIEADPDREDWAEWYARRIQFCQWTIQAKPGHPVLREIVAHITETTLRLQKQKELTKGKLPTTINVMDYTGPGVWTDTVFSYFNNREYFDFSSRTSNISVSEFFGITEHKKVGDVVVLPITSFSPGVGQMGAGDRSDPMAFVHHDFEGRFVTDHGEITLTSDTGSWKPEAERMTDS